MKFSEKVGNGPVNKRLNFRGELDHGCDPDPYRDTGKTCLGGGMQCASASRYADDHKRSEWKLFHWI